MHRKPSFTREFTLVSGQSGLRVRAVAKLSAGIGGWLVVGFFWGWSALEAGEKTTNYKLYGRFAHYFSRLHVDARGQHEVLNTMATLRSSTLEVASPRPNKNSGPNLHMRKALPKSPDASHELECRHVSYAANIIDAHVRYELRADASDDMSVLLLLHLLI